MKLKGLAFWLIFVLAVSLQACGTAQPTATDDDEAERLSTSVAGTLAAITKAPTDTGTPAPTGTPTLTPTPQPGPLRVVYSRAGSIWIWTEGGQPKQLTNNIVDAKPRLSDDGKLVVFERNNELYAISADGSNLHVLVSNAFLKDYRPSGYKFIWAEYYDWMPDSHLLYFSTKTGISGPETDIYQLDLFLANVNSGEVRQVVAPGSGGIPYFSPDGQKIALVQPEAINLVNADGGGLRKALTFDPVDMYSDAAPPYFPAVVTLPDGSGFRMIIPAQNWLQDLSEQAKLWDIPVTGNPVLVFSFTTNDLPYNMLSSNNSLSPDGKAVWYSVVYTGGTVFTSRVCLYRQDGGPEKCFNHDGEFKFCNWSLDSSKFIYYYVSQREPGFYLGDATNGNSSLIVTTSLMAWVDNNRYLFVNEDGNLYLASLDGTQAKIDKGISKVSGNGNWSQQFGFSY